MKKSVLSMKLVHILGGFFFQKVALLIFAMPVKLHFLFRLHIICNTSKGKCYDFCLIYPAILKISCF